MSSAAPHQEGGLETGLRVTGEGQRGLLLKGHRKWVTTGLLARRGEADGELEHTSSWWSQGCALVPPDR